MQGDRILSIIIIGVTYCTPRENSFINKINNEESK